MNKAQKEIELAKLAEEKRQLNVLKAIYKKAAEDVNKSLVITNGKIEVMLSEIDDLDDDTKSVLRSQIYHKNFQEGISRQLNGFLNELNRNQYKSIDEYLNACYETGFVGAAYELADQGIPLIMPIDQKKVVKAISIDSKISKPLYTKLGEDVDLLKKRIANNISRGIAFSDSYDNIARNIRNDSNVGFNKAMRIVRTEGHRVHVESSFDAMKEAQSKGADIVKQWNSQLDGKTRPHHRQLDGQIRELDEPFELNGIKVKYPSAFGRPEEDINCRCVIHQRAKWALDEEELETLKERASFHGLRVNDSKAFGQEKAKDFADFKKKYLNVTTSKTEIKRMASISKLNNGVSFTSATNIKEAEDFIKQFVDDTQFGALGVSYSGITVEAANAVNEALYKLYSTYNLNKLGGVYVAKGNTKLGKLLEGAVAGYSPVRNSLALNSRAMKNLDDIAIAKVTEIRLIEKYKNNPSSLRFKSAAAENAVKMSLTSGRATVPDNIEDVINHEMGHAIEKVIGNAPNFEIIKNNQSMYAEKISGYATHDFGEYIAESFASYRKGENLIDPELEKFFVSLEK